ncbi:DUF2892 domain-containing protein [Candidatus Woesearchaeota archaeon]|nr:DUF2892 domain-containing protein [Candidatus Woesearchaeota archaeon]
MEKNIGRTDKRLRFIFGLVFAYFGYAYHWLWYIIGAILLITSFTGSCAIYKLLKFNTLAKKK